MRFDYEEAEQDIFDSGADPDYLDHYNPERRDKYLKSLGLDPRDYEPHGHDASRNHSRSSSSSFSLFSDPEPEQDEGCFLTTACTAARNLPDDCYELQTLRKYRDSYLNGFAEGIAAVNNYYDIAPKIVSAIDALPEANEIWKNVYNDLVLPCIKLIEDGNNEEAYTVYRDYTFNLADKYL